MTATVDAAAGVDADLARLVETLDGISDGDLHRAGFGGGWTVARVVSHITGRLDLEPMVTHRFSLDDVVEVFAIAASKSDGAIKVIVEP